MAERRVRSSLEGSPKPKGRWKKFLAGLAGGVLVLVAVGALLLQRLDGWLHTRMQQAADSWGQQVGRRVEVGPVHTLLRSGAVSVEQIRIGPAGGEAAPLLTLDRLEVGIALWEAIRSQGQRIELRQVTLVRPVVTLTWQGSGELNAASLLRALDGLRTHGDASMTVGRASQNVADLHVGHARIEAGRLLVLDPVHSTREWALEDINVALNDLRADQPIEAQLRATLVHPQGRVDLKVTTAPRSASAFFLAPEGLTVAFSGGGQVTDLDFRHLGWLNVGPSDAVTGSVTGSCRLPLDAQADPDLSITALSVAAKGQRITGALRLHGAEREAVLQSDHLDLDALLMPIAEHASPTHAAPASLSGSTRALPSATVKVPVSESSRSSGPATRAAVPTTHRLSGHLQLRVAVLRWQQQDFQKVDASLSLADGHLRADRLDASLRGGSLAFGGSQLALPPGPTSIELQGRAKNLSLSLFLPHSVRPDLVAGGFSGTVALRAPNLDHSTLRHGLSGSLQGTINDGTFRGGDLLEAVAGPVAKSLPFGVTLPKEEVTSLGKALPIDLRLSDGGIRFEHPLHIQQERGGLTVDGKIGLEGQLELSGLLELAPASVEQLTKGLVKLSGPLPLSFQIGGTTAAPRVIALDLGPTIRQLGSQAARAGLKRLFGGSKEAKPAP